MCPEYTSKAWSVRRIGSTVLLKWGAVRYVGRVRQTDLLGRSTSAENCQV